MRIENRTLPPELARAPTGTGTGGDTTVNHPVLPYRHITRHDSREAKYDKKINKSCVPLKSKFSPRKKIK